MILGLVLQVFLLVDLVLFYRELVDLLSMGIEVTQVDVSLSA